MIDVFVLVFLLVLYLVILYLTMDHQADKTMYCAKLSMGGYSTIDLRDWFPSHCFCQMVFLMWSFRQML